jgi:acetyl esterase/lipase
MNKVSKLRWWWSLFGLLLLTNVGMSDAIKKTFTYKTVGSLKIKADVYQSPSTGVRPVVVWIHGGALIMGGRQSVNSRIREMVLEAGFD